MRLKRNYLILVKKVCNQKKHEIGHSRGYKTISFFKVHIFGKKVKKEHIRQSTLVRTMGFNINFKNNLRAFLENLGRQSNTRLHKQAHRDTIQQIIGLLTFNLDIQNLLLETQGRLDAKEGLARTFHLRKKWPRGRKKWPW